MKMLSKRQREKKTSHMGSAVEILAVLWGVHSGGTAGAGVRALFGDGGQLFVFSSTFISQIEMSCGPPLGRAGVGCGCPVTEARAHSYDWEQQSHLQLQKAR